MWDLSRAHKFWVRAIPMKGGQAQTSLHKELTQKDRKTRLPCPTRGSNPGSSDLILNSNVLTRATPPPIRLSFNSGLSIYGLRAFLNGRRVFQRERYSSGPIYIMQACTSMHTHMYAKQIPDVIFHLANKLLEYTNTLLRIFRALS